MFSVLRGHLRACSSGHILHHARTQTRPQYDLQPYLFASTGLSQGAEYAACGGFGGVGVKRGVLMSRKPHRNRSR